MKRLEIALLVILAALAVYVLIGRSADIKHTIAPSVPIKSSAYKEEPIASVSSSQDRQSSNATAQYFIAHSDNQQIAGSGRLLEKNIHSPNSSNAAQPVVGTLGQAVVMTHLDTEVQGKEIGLEQHLQERFRLCLVPPTVVFNVCRAVSDTVESMADEPRDLIWADTVETKISEYLSRPEIAQVLTVHDIECRQVTCAVQVTSKVGAGSVRTSYGIVDTEVAGNMVEMGMVEMSPSYKDSAGGKRSSHIILLKRKK